MDEEPPWPEVLKDPNVVRKVVDQRRFGMRSGGMLVKKPSEVLASSKILITHFKGKRCTGDHDHATLEGSRCDTAKLRTWEFSRAVVNGIGDLLLSIKQLNGSHVLWNVDASVEQMFDATPSDAAVSLRKALTHLTRWPTPRSALDAKMDRAGTIPDTLVYLENADGPSLKPSIIHVLPAKPDYLLEKEATP